MVNEITFEGFRGGNRPNRSPWTRPCSCSFPVRLLQAPSITSKNQPSVFNVALEKQRLRCGSVWD